MINPHSSIWPAEAIPFIRSALHRIQSIKDLKQDLASQAANHPMTPLPYSTFLKEASILQEAGCLDIQLQNLTNYISLNDSHIHPLFSSMNWDQTGVESFIRPAYEAMRPAFALATKMITCDSLLGWWIRVLYGRLREDEATGRRYFAPDLEREQNLPQAKKELEAVFKKLGDKLRWHWKPENEASASTNRNAWGALGSWTKDDSFAKFADRNEISPLINLPTLFLYHLLSPRGAKRRSMSSNIRLQFHIAKILVHELAHAFNVFIHPNNPEPYIFLDDYMPEAGFSWQKSVFGQCELSTVPCIKAGVGAMYATDLEYAYAFPSLGVPLGTQWVERFFLKKTWDGIVDNEAFKVITARQLPNKYEGLLYVDRYFQAGNIWVKVLYHDGNAMPLNRREVLGAPVPMSTQFSATTYPGLGSLQNTVLEWFDQVAKRDVHKATRNGFPKYCFTKGRGLFYERQCYDGKGDSGSY